MVRSHLKARGVDPCRCQVLTIGRFSDTMGDTREVKALDELDATAILCGQRCQVRIMSPAIKV